MVQRTGGQKLTNGAQRRASAGSEKTPGVIETSLKLHEDGASTEGASPLGCFFAALTRKKPLDCRTDTNLNRCLNLTQLTALGVGSTLGLGLYVLAGQVACNKAGPGVVISFAMAALASTFSALCYAEFAGRVPRAGSAYAYSYISVGEFVAFVIGWNLILEYVIGAASVARGFSGYLQFVYNRAAESLTGVHVPPSTAFKNVSTSAILTTISSKSQIANATASPATGLVDSVVDYVVRYFDWPSVAIVVVVAAFILLGVKDSTNVTLAFTSVNVFVVVVVVISSLRHLNPHNWQLTKAEVPPGFGSGGFLPYGWAGVLAGSATCFFGFIGFDTIASSAEEAKNPRRNVPLSIMLSLFISFIAYMAIAIVQTLLWPYYDQDNITILPYIFEQLDMPATYWIILVGAIAGLASSQMGGMFPLPRILYSMAQDRLIYGFLSHVNRRLKLPVRATIIGSIFVAALACLLDIQDLADMVSIGTLAAYSLVSVSVLLLRYENRNDAVDDSTLLSSRLSLSDIRNANGEATLAKTEAMCAINELSETPCAEPDPSCIKKSPLTAKVSTPIRTRGSRPLVAQLSAGFHSWFKDCEGAIGTNEQQVDLPSELQNNATTTKRKSKRTLLDLLTLWKSDEIEANEQEGPDEDSRRLSRILITAIVGLSIVLDLLALCFAYTFSSPEDPLAPKLKSGEQAQAEHMIVRAVRTASGHLAAEPRILISYSACIVIFALASAVLMLSRLPTSKLNQRADAFQVPWVPLIPTLSILVNTFLMLNLSFLTWIRFTVWMSIGLFIYFTYGLWNSRGYLLHMST